jgi:cobalt/nickel transport system permease protein
MLPVWFWVLGLILTLGLVLWGLKRLGADRRRLPMVAMMAAVALVAVSIPLPFGLPLHLNLAALAGIVLGPVLGFLAIFVVNLLSALIGHGGMTLLGVNTLLVGSEALVAGLIFSFLGGAKFLLRNVGIGVVAALLISTLLVVGVVAVAEIELETLVDHGHDHGEPVAGEPHDHEHGFLETFLKIIAPLIAIWIALELGLSVLIVRFVRKVRGQWFSLEG